MLNSWKNETGKPETPAQAAAKPVDTKPTPTAGNGIAISVPKLDEPKAIGNSTIDACLTMRGDLESEADILVKGKVYGNVRCNLLIVDAGANIEGGINAREVVIRGKVNGVVKAEKVRLDKSAEVESDIFQNVFVAEEGARILGSLKSLKDAPAQFATKSANGSAQTGKAAA